MCTLKILVPQRYLIEGNWDEKKNRIPPALYRLLDPTMTYNFMFAIKSGREDFLDGIVIEVTDAIFKEELGRLIQQIAADVFGPIFSAHVGVTIRLRTSSGSR